MKEYIYVQPQIVGNLEDGFEYSHSSDLERFKTRELAQKHGEDLLEHDDFWVAELEGDKLLALYSGEDECDEEEMDGVRYEFCFK